MTAKLCADVIGRGAVWDPAMEEVFARLQRAHHQLSEHIDNSLIQARLIEKHRPDLQAVCVSKLIEEVIDQVRPLADQKRISLDLELDEDLVATVDPKLMESAMANLLTNAIKFSGTVSSVGIQCGALVGCRNRGTRQGRQLVENAD